MHTVETVLPGSPTVNGINGSSISNGVRYEMRSPRDLTCGTFAQAQMKATLDMATVNGSNDGQEGDGGVPALDDLVQNVMGNGNDGGVVFLMSGGGKGPAGKSRAKFKSKSDGCCGSVSVTRI